MEVFRGKIVANMVTLLSNYLLYKKISVLEINAYLGELSQSITRDIADAFKEFGVELTDFFVESVNVPEQDESIKKLKNALSKKASIDILNKNYKEERLLDIMQDAACNEGAAGDIARAGIGLGTGLRIGKAFNEMLHTDPKTEKAPAQSEDTIFCRYCSEAIPLDSVFCYKCGKKL